jgi:hypothetical protein
VTCPHCGSAAAFHSHRVHQPHSLVGPVRYQRAYYLCRRCGVGLFPFDEQAGLTERNLTPGLERVVALAGTVAEGFGKGAEFIDEMAGTHLSESTVERTTEDAGTRLAQALGAGETFGPKLVWHWYKDAKGRRVAYVGLDATGVRQQGKGGAKAEGRMAYVGMIYNAPPVPEWLEPQTRRPEMQARYISGLYPLAEMGPLLRRQAAQVAMAEADCWIGLSDAGSGLEDHIEDNFPLVYVVILDFYHPAERLMGLARLLHATDEAAAEQQGRAWCRMMKEEGGALMAGVLREWEWPSGRVGLSEKVAETVGYLEHNAHRMEYPEYLAEGWHIGSGPVESACKTLVGQRLKLAGMRWGEEGSHAVCHLRALYRSEKGQWDAFWNRQATKVNACPTN